jgi:hypothetical protein
LGFRVERAPASGGPWTVLGLTTQTGYGDSNLTPATTYYYRVAAYNAAGDSPFSNVASATTFSATPNLWSRRFGNSQDDRGQAVAVDTLGRVAVTGSFYGATDFGGGQVSSYVHPTLGPTMDIFVAGYASNGTYSWARVIGADSDEAGKGIATDASGNVLVTGYQGSYLVDYGGGPQSNRGGNDIFIAKYSSAGSWVWSKTIGGTGYEQGNAIAADATGNVFVTGYIGSGSGGPDFGGGALFSAGLSDVFLVKYSPTGSHVWSQRFGGSGNDTGMALATDAAGNVYVIGSFEQSVNFGGGSFTSAGLRDVFVAKYSATGAHVWSKRFGSSGDDVGYGLAVDSAGDVLITGKFQGSVGFGGTSLTSAGGDDIFLVKLSGANGSHVWSKDFGNTSGDVALGVSVDSNKNVAMTGYFTGSINLGGTLLSGSGLDVFVAKYDSGGTHQWSKRFGGFDTQIGNSIGMSSGGNVSITGYFSTTLDLGSGVLTSVGSYDAFVGSIGP